jgi:Helix-turn-helix domain
MRCYSHLSDDEREQIGLTKAVGHSIGAIAKELTDVTLATFYEGDADPFSSNEEIRVNSR